MTYDNFNFLKYKVVKFNMKAIIGPIWEQKKYNLFYLTSQKKLVMLPILKKPKTLILYPTAE